MNPEKITVNAFCVIGKVDSTDDGKDIVQRLQKFSGIQKMVIESYNPKWLQQFILIKQMLEQNLREYISIEHVGSTSIPGIKAKPIIDIDVVVQDEAQFLSVKEDLEKIGYVYKGDLGISGREAFDEDNVSIKIAHHLYVCK